MPWGVSKVSRIRHLSRKGAPTSTRGRNNPKMSRWTAKFVQISELGCFDLKYPSSYARFTLPNPMPRLAFDVVGGKSGRNHLTSRRHPIDIGWMARSAYIRVGWYNIVNPFTLAKPTASGHNRGIGSANVKRALVVLAFTGYGASCVVTNMLWFTPIWWAKLPVGPSFRTGSLLIQLLVPILHRPLKGN